MLHNWTHTMHYVYYILLVELRKVNIFLKGKKEKNDKSTSDFADNSETIV